ncbi:bifunctional tetrahydrofolate synthase/dihydrofolate synthase [Lentibacillus halophilus]|uniref:tetrahydrofolate synthase n=1 Tax=Lentibacillus halophilus TaxID=295065 RepID=A0ABP3J8N9_9BACI
MFSYYYQVETFFHDRKQLGMKPGLDRTQQLLQYLGNPQKQVEAVHVAGTNGKGSTVQYIKSGLMANNVRVGVFQSPSMDGIKGHISLGHHYIPEETIISLMNQLYPCIKQMDQKHHAPTMFEIITAIAFVYFKDHADIAIIEAGMGGRYDTTNCFQPLIAIITNVEKDHTAFLGDTIEKIAWHKAGIIQENKPIITGEITEEAYNSIVAEAQQKNAPMLSAGQAFQTETIYADKHNWTFRWKAAHEGVLNVSIKASGSHQINNASLAMMTLSIMRRRGFQLNWGKTLQGLATAVIPGRFEYVCQDPVVIVDSAHNPAGAQALTNTLAVQCAGMNCHLIFAAFRDKDIKEMLRRLENQFATVTLTTFVHPRAASTTELCQYSQRSDVRLIDDWKQAVDNVYQLQQNSCYVITGSLHFIASVRKYFEG